MRWKQFFTPVKSFNVDEAKDFIDRVPGYRLTLLDVRQPGEYESEHIPGAKLIPLPDLNDRMTELDADKPTIVYCAIGGRSRMAAQMLATTIGVPFDLDKDYDERKEQYKLGRQIITTRQVTQSAEGQKNGMWTTVLAAAVLIGEWK